MSFHDTYQIATSGQNLTNSFTLASNGILIDIFIDDLPPIIIPIEPIEYSGGIFTDEREKKVTRKRITVVATVGGIDYKKSIIVEDRPSLTVKDVDVDVQVTDNKPIIKITLNM